MTFDLNVYYNEVVKLSHQNNWDKKNLPTSRVTL